MLSIQFAGPPSPDDLAAFPVDHPYNIKASITEEDEPIIEGRRGRPKIMYRLLKPPPSQPIADLVLLPFPKLKHICRFEKGGLQGDEEKLQFTNLPLHQKEIKSNLVYQNLTVSQTDYIDVHFSRNNNFI